MPASARMAPNRPGNVPSRSLITNRARQPASSRSITRFLAACAARDAAGRAVAPGILIVRLACSITASTCSRAPDKVTVSNKSPASRAPAGERRKPAHVAGLRPGAGSIPASCKISQTVKGGGPLPRARQLAVHPAIPPAGILPDQPQHQDANRARGARPAPVPGRDRRAGRRAATSRCQPSTVSGRTTTCTLLSTSLGSRCKQRRQQRPITRGEPHRVRTELPLQDPEPAAQRQDPRVFVLAAHRQQTQQREHVHHTDTGHSQQHGRSPCHNIPPS
jgi:hypothetical protein